MKRVETALSYYRVAYDYAVKLGDINRKKQSKEWESLCLRHLGRLSEALSCLIELEEMQEDNEKERLDNLINQIHIAVRIPLRLDVIETAVSDAYDILKERQSSLSGSTLALEESSLYTFRNMFDKALEKALHALDLYQNAAPAPDASPTYDAKVYYYTVCACFCDMRQRDKAAEYLKLLENVDSPMEQSKELNILSLRRRIALLEGKNDAAKEYARQRLALEKNDLSYVGLRDLVESELLCGNVEEVEKYLKILWEKNRESENRHRQYELLCLKGLCAVARDSYEEAVSYYRQADKVGRELDDALKCDWRQKEIEEKLREIYEFTDS